MDVPSKALAPINDWKSQLGDYCRQPCYICVTISKEHIVSVKGYNMRQEDEGIGIVCLQESQSYLYWSARSVHVANSARVPGRPSAAEASLDTSVILI